MTETPQQYTQRLLGYVEGQEPLAGFPSVIVGCLEMMLESVRM